MIPLQYSLDIQGVQNVKPDTGYGNYFGTYHNYSNLIVKLISKF